MQARGNIARRPGLLRCHCLVVPEGPPVLEQRRAVGYVLLGEDPPGPARVPDQRLVVGVFWAMLLRPAGHVRDDPASGGHIGEALPEQPVQHDVAGGFYEVELRTEPGPDRRCYEDQLGVVVPLDVVAPNERREARVVENAHKGEAPAVGIAAPNKVALLGAGTFSWGTCSVEGLSVEVAGGPCPAPGGGGTVSTSTTPAIVPDGAATTTHFPLNPGSIRAWQ